MQKLYRQKTNFLVWMKLQQRSLLRQKLKLKNDFLVKLFSNNAFKHNFAKCEFLNGQFLVEFFCRSNFAEIFMSE